MDDMQEFDQVERLMGEIHYLLLRLQEIDPDAVYRMEQIMSKMRAHKVVEQRLH